MKNLAQMVFLATLCAALAGCGSRGDTQTTPDEPDYTPEPRDTTPVETSSYGGATDYTSPEGFDDPQNLLYKRVVYFDFDQSRIKAEYRDIIAAHATYLSANGGARVTLEGHADERGTREYNLGLGERRGNAVADVMDAQGASSSQLSVVSYGEERPVANCSDESCWSRNRRVEIIYTRQQ